jgi:alpha-ketoglutarate-dependent taurine dioxygenase
MTIALDVLQSAVTDPTLDIVPVSGRIGAEIRGVDIAAPLSDAIARAIWTALGRHKVLFFRGAHLDDAGHERFAATLGDPVAHPTVGGIGPSAHLMELDSRYGAHTNSWHTDVTFVPAYPAASILRAVVVPDFGGDTVWANTASAYLDLPDALRDLADQLWAVHTNLFDYAIAPPLTSDDSAQYARVASKPYRTDHPLVRVHPETGERTLVLGHFVQKVLGVSSADSVRLFQTFQDYITRLENTVRWRWQAGDVAIWDNRATQHYAIADYGDRHRVMRRITLAGDLPVALDGQVSRARDVTGA